MGAYQTRQKKALLAFFQQRRGQSYTIEEAVSLLEQECPDGVRIGRSTAYRLIPAFVADGTLRRFSPEGERSSRYQYVGDPACTQHLHLKCTRCGELFHLGHALSEGIVQEIWEGLGLSLSKGETLLLGTCQKCEHA